MKLYSIIYNFFDFISCKTVPEDVEPIDGYLTDDNKILKWPHQYFMDR
jgi:hypothetical protein